MHQYLCSKSVVCVFVKLICFFLVQLTDARQTDLKLKLVQRMFLISFADFASQLVRSILSGCSTHHILHKQHLCMQHVHTHIHSNFPFRAVVTRHGARTAFSQLPDNIVQWNCTLTDTSIPNNLPDKYRVKLRERGESA